MHTVTMNEVLDAMTRDLARSIHDARMTADYLVLLQEVLERAKEHIQETFRPDTLNIPAPVRLQASCLACIIAGILGTEAYVTSYTLQDVSQASVWLATWQTAIELDINR